MKRTVVLLSILLLALPAGMFAQGKTPLQFYAWSFMPDKIKEYNTYFENNWNEKTEVHALPNLGYVPAIQTRIMGGARTDVMYNFEWNQLRWFNVGWAAEITNMPGAKDILADIIESAKQRYLTPDGKMISVPYYIAPYVTMYNARLLKQVGINSFPKTKEELYEACKALKNAGVQSPYIAYWNQDFIDQYLFVYLISEGIEVFDNNFDPVFQNNPETEKVFEWWSKMYKEGLTSPTIFTDHITDFSLMMQQGKSAFYNLHHYFLKSIVAAGGKESANIKLGPWEPGKSGKVLLVGDVIQMSGTTPDKTRAWELLKFYSWKNRDGSYFVPKTWALSAGLLEPYKGFLADKEIQDSFKKWIDWDTLMDLVNNKSIVEQVRFQVWYPNFKDDVVPILHKMVIGDIAAKDAIQQIVQVAKADKDAAQ